MSEQSAAKFANRRPGWQPAELNISNLQLHSFADLERATARQACPKCQRSRFLYCYDCLVPFTPVPSLQLPFQLSIITHHAEAASKNTGVHAALLCPQQVQLHSIDEMPPVDPSCCVVMFPTDDALLPEQLDLQQLDRVIIIDSKWRKAKELNAHQALQGMKRVKLPGTPKSCFWRFHTEGVADEGVCTIEALHLLLSAVAGRLAELPCEGTPHYFDNLLWYFAFQHQLVTKAAAERLQRKQQQSEQHQPKVQQSKKNKKQEQQQQLLGQSGPDGNLPLHHLQQEQQKEQHQFGPSTGDQPEIQQSKRRKVGA